MMRELEKAPRIWRVNALQHHSRNRQSTSASYKSLGLGVLLALFGACHKSGPVDSSGSSAPVAAPMANAGRTPADEQARTRCEEERERVSRLPGLPGAPKLEAQRVSVLAKAKAEPVWFVDVPRFDQAPRSVRQ
ncbi:MAG TPA: hypothetical protein VGJ84_20100, partial [Polyangiaceae bacterium]